MNKAKQTDILIVGTGHGGAQAAISLRQNGFAGSILMVGRDSFPPYERPPLSKEYLAGEKAFERILIRPATFWDDKQIALQLGVAVVRIDAAKHEASLEDGTVIRYGRMIWAAGGDPRSLACAGADLDGVHAVRSRADVDRLISELEDGARRAVVVGGGYIGLEAAAVLRKLDCEVTLLEALPRILARVAGTDLSRFYEREHRAQGVDLRLGALVESIEGTGGRVSGVRLAGGEVLDADIVIVGIGIIPAVEPLRAAGADGADGVDVDALCRTALPDIYAIGDCAAHANIWADKDVLRVESVQNAVDMAGVAARAICGQERPYEAIPWFWSNQYDLRLQTVGLSAGHDDTVLRGDPDTRKFSVVYLKAGRVIALDCVNSVKDYAQGRKLVETRAAPAKDALADPETPLKTLLTEARG